ncbi:hypothetical protein [Fulvimarina sp. MAC8]
MLGLHDMPLLIGGPNLLNEDEIGDTVNSFGSYGLQDHTDMAA